MKLTCNQNKIFGCGKSTDFTPTYIVLGLSLLRYHVAGQCSHCGLPLASFGNPRTPSTAYYCD